MSDPHRRLGDEISISGDYQYKALTKGFVVQRYWHLAKQRLIENAFPTSPGDKALDCGCGSGVIADFLASHCEEAVGVDANGEAIRFAQSQFKRANLKYVRALVEEIDYPAGYFSRIVCMEVIEHLYEAQARSILSRFHELLSPGGMMLITTPNYRGVWPVLEWLVDHSGMAPPMEGFQHVTHFHRSQLAAAAQAAGFQVVRTGVFCTLAPFLSVFGQRFADAIFRMEMALTIPFGPVLFLIGKKI
ncbi:MAG: class I SAM-dependent methyltransferase [Candidatus Sumerlaeota bacterium]|nr:class I SAM-dependent methyltransferase [Candidatus Sumerlaeota bacterium]